MLLLIPDVPDPALGAVVGAAWAVVVIASIYQYHTGSRSRRRFYLTICVGAFWLAYSLLQISAGVAGAVEIVVVVLAVGCVPIGIGAGIRWRRSAGSDGKHDTTG